MLALGWFELARLSIEEALHSLPETPFYVILHLEILRRLDLQLAVAEAERWVAAPATDARILAACLNVLAIQADNLPDDQIDAFRSLFEDAIQRFDRAPGRGAVDVSTLALLLVNCGLLALRSGRIPEARDVFHLARQIDPNDPDVRVFSQVESFDDMARQAASRLHARPIDRQMAA
jgi:tetratricopeptide (TPR) repeat protein